MRDVLPSLPLSVSHASTVPALKLGALAGKIATTVSSAEPSVSIVTSRPSGSLTANSKNASPATVSSLHPKAAAPSASATDSA
jgi:hypothetical protein